jgi:heat shock protein HslJ
MANLINLLTKSNEKMKILNLIKLILLLSFTSVIVSACVDKSIDKGTDTVRPEVLVPTTASGVSDLVADAPKQISTQKLTDILGNLSYSGLFPDKQITLSDGVANYNDGGSGHPFVRLVDHIINTGDLNGDKVLDAIAILEDNSSGTGNFIFLAPVLNVLGEPKPLESLMIGDRTPVKSLTIDAGTVVVELISQNEDDPACCPKMIVRKTYTVAGEKLVEQSSEELGNVSVNDLSGTCWQLLYMNTDQEPISPNTKITLNFEDNRISGSAGCNFYNSVVTGEDVSPQLLKLGEISTTRKTCTDLVLLQEKEFLSNLVRVRSWRYDFSRLAITYEMADGTLSDLIFIPKVEEMAVDEIAKPENVKDLETAYGAPSQAGFGSAVFYEKNVTADNLEKKALEKYEYFLGELWEKYGQETWMGQWKEVYSRKIDEEHDIVSELSGISDSEAVISVSLVLEGIEEADRARLALSSVYDDPSISNLRVYSIGDGGAMSGILITGQSNETGEAVFLVVLMD